MVKHITLPVLAGFGISVLLGLVIIPVLRRLKMDQTEREDGVKAHLQKAGTPTMGGIIFLLAFTAVTLFYVKEAPAVIPVLLLTVGFGLIGFLDDFLKVVLKRSDGLLPKQKMLLQLLVTGVFAWYMAALSEIGLSMRLPFSQGKMLSLGWLSLPLLFFAVLGTVNGVNFTDGLDGLASSVTVVVAAFFLFAAVSLNNGVTPASSALIGALLGFLLFNAYPAKVFMGDTGSLALGGFVAGCAYVLQMPIYIVIVGLIYLAEVLSVILQVAYFKKTGGKRIFKMAPIHHHFELCGWSETRVVTAFTVITLLLCLLAAIRL